MKSNDSKTELFLFKAKINCCGTISELTLAARSPDEAEEIVKRNIHILSVEKEEVNMTGNTIGSVSNLTLME